jgi:tellurite methyltransferase
MSIEHRAVWETRHEGARVGLPEPSLTEMLPLIPPGLAMDLAAGNGRNAIALAEAGFRVIAVDFSENATRALAVLARARQLSIMAIKADLEVTVPILPNRLDAIINVSYLDRVQIPALKDALRIGGMLFFDTFLIDQAALGHPSNPHFMLQHYELRELLSDMELIRYREGLTIYSDTRQVWRATALARKRG